MIEYTIISFLYNGEMIHHCRYEDNVTGNVPQEVLPQRIRAEHESIMRDPKILRLETKVVRG